MLLYKLLCKALKENVIDELGLLPAIPDLEELPLESRVYYPLVVIETKLGISKANLATLLKEAHTYYITLSDTGYEALEECTRIMILLKPDNYTAMNRRKSLILLDKIDIKKELDFIELIFTIPKHSKSSVAWYHRQWILKTRCKPAEIDISKELKLCVMASNTYPRNYYAWTYRLWIVSTYCAQNTALLQHEYKETCHWIDKNISDYSGFQYLQQLIDLLKLESQDHIKWVDRLIIKYPGHESLWCHKRFCSSLFIASNEYCISQHRFIDDIMNDRFTDQSLSDKYNDVILQKEFALKFGLFHCLMEKRNNPSAFSRCNETLYSSIAPIPNFLNRE